MRPPHLAFPAQDSGSANYALAVLLGAYVLSFVDRNVMAVLIGPIREDFAISDFQYSLLHGFAFSMFYIFLGLPIGRLADAWNRKWIITVGIFFWSAATALCGLARNFHLLFLARMGVGVGEAALSPPAYSLLSDYFSAERLPRAMAVYTLGITLGGGLAYIVGGSVYGYFQSLPRASYDWLGNIRPWQLTFLVVAAPGLLIGTLMMLVREPRRNGDGGGNDPGEKVPISAVIQQLRTYRGVYGSLILGVSLLSVVGYGTMAWYAEYLIRVHGYERATAGSLFGTVFIVAGSLGTLAGGWSPVLLRRLGYEDANMRVVMLVPLLWVVPAVAGPLATSATWAVVLAVPIVFFLNSYFGVCIAALQLVTPNRMRAQISALLLFSTNLFGLALGPSLVALFTDYVFGHDSALSYSLALMAALACPLAAMILGAGLKHYRAALDVHG